MGAAHLAAFSFPGAAVYLRYLDDSGSVGNQNEQHLVLGGVAVFERQVHWVSQKLEELATKLCPEAPDTVEFHAADIRSHRKPPWRDMDAEKRKEVTTAVLGALADSHPTTRAFACAVHKKSFPSRDPMEIAFEELCNRFDMLLKRIHFESGKKGPQRGLIILDESSYETSLQKLAMGFRCEGTRWGVTRNIVDVPMFVDSRASRLVQLADHVAYAVSRRYESSDASYLDKIIHKFDAEGGKLHGLIHKQHYAAKCMCPACMSRSLTQGGSCSSSLDADPEQ